MLWIIIGNIIKWWGRSRGRNRQNLWYHKPQWSFSLVQMSFDMCGMSTEIIVRRRIKRFAPIFQSNDRISSEYPIPPKQFEHVTNWFEYYLSQARLEMELGWAEEYRSFTNISCLVVVWYCILLHPGAVQIETYWDILDSVELQSGILQMDL